MFFQSILRGAAYAGAIFLGLGATQSANAAIISVTSTGDSVAVDGAVTLREAIQSTNADADVNSDVTGNRVGEYSSTTDRDGISLYTLSPGIKTCVLGGGELTISSDVNIFGNGARAFSLSANNASRHFTINSGVHALIAGLTLRDGKRDTATLADGAGGAILLQQGASLELQDCVLSNNVSYYGAIYAPYQSNLRLLNCTFAGNSADGNAGVLNQGTATVTRCTFKDSSSGGGSGFANGNVGAATLLDCTFANNMGTALLNDNIVTATNCTFTGNSAQLVGGAVSSGGALSMTNCTLAGNSAGNGGAMYIGGGKVLLTHCTLSGNSGQGGIGGIYNFGVVATNNTIFNDVNRNILNAQNFDLTRQGSIADGGNNLSNDTTGPNNGTTDKINVAPKLGPLQNNGGPTQTLALLPGSPAIDAGSSRVTVDQRGATRDTKHDIGAYELNSAPTIVSLVPQAGSDRVGAKRTFTLVTNDANGAGDIQEMWLLINTRLNWGEGATLVYKPNAASPANGQLYLRGAYDFLPAMTIGEGAKPGAVLDNGAVRVVGSEVHVSSAGGRITVTLPLTIRDGLVGKNTLYSYVQDRAGAVDPTGTFDNFRVFGNYTVIPQFKDSVNDAPTLSRLTPGTASSTVSSQGIAPPVQFSFSARDEDGTGDISRLSFTVGRTRTGGVTLIYDHRTRNLSVAPVDGQGGFGGGGQIGSATLIVTPAFNIELSKAKVLIYGDGKSFGLILPLQARTKLAGANTVWLRVQDRDGATAPNGDADGYVQSGTWNVTLGTSAASDSPAPSGNHS